MIAKLRKLYFSDKPLLMEWVIVALVSGIMLISFFYIDTRSLTVWSVNLLDAVTDGRVKDFYLICYINEYGASSEICFGPFYQLIPWAIWNIPIWLIQKCFRIAIVSNGWMMLWSKLFLVVAEGVVLLFSYKITMLLTQDRLKSWWVVFLTSSFPFLLIGVYYSGQTDILILAYASIAIYELLKKNNKLFLLFATIAISSKPFFAFPFIILILFTEKNVIRILGKLVIAFIPTVIFNLLYANAPMYKEAGELTASGDNLDMLTRTTFGRVLYTDGSWFFLLFVILCVFAYIKKEDDRIKKNKLIIYFTVAPILLLLGFTTIQHYRPIYLAPFLFILFAINDSWYRINIILKSFYSVTTIFPMCCWTTNMFNRKSIENTLITHLFTLKIDGKYDSFKELVTTVIDNVDIYHKISASVSVACIVVMLIINCPYFRVKPDVPSNKCERWILWIDLLVMLAILYVGFRIFF